MKVVKELQDLRYLNWSKVRHSSGTAGTLLKAEENSKEGMSEPDYPVTCSSYRLGGHAWYSKLRDI
jgi:hypothetical protein